MTIRLVRTGLFGLMIAALAACSDDDGGGNNGGGGATNTAPVITQIFTNPSPVRIGQSAEVVVTAVANDADGDSLNFSWRQVDSGPVVTLRNAATQAVSFDAPSRAEVDATDNQITLEVTVSDATLQAVDTIQITFQGEDASEVSVTAATARSTVNAGDEVTLSATAEPALDSIGFSWVQLSGPSVSLSGANTDTASFTAPQTDDGGDPLTQQATLQFRVSVTDEDGNLADTDSVEITILPLPLSAGPANVYVGLNGENTAGTVRKLVESPAGSQQLIADLAITTDENEGLALDVLGNAVQVGDDASPGLSFVCDIGGRLSNNSFDAARDRRIAGDNVDVDTGPGAKGMVLLDTAGLLVVADFNNQQLKVYGTGASGNQAPLRTITLGAQPWDVAYDDVHDILYAAATNGTVRAIDGFVAKINAGNSALETRTFQITDGNGTVISQNLHGIAYVAAGDRLVLTDVGDTNADASADFASDGAVFTVSNVRNAGGGVVIDNAFLGTNTLLGNPVDVIVWGRDIVVAEKANGQVLVFKDVFTAQGGNVAPFHSVSLEAPESVALEPLVDLPAGGSDIAPGTPDIASVIVAMDDDSNLRLLNFAPTLGDQPQPGVFSDDNAQPHSRGLVATQTGDVIALSHGDEVVIGVPPLGTTTPAESRLNIISGLALGRFGTVESPSAPDPSRDRAFDFTNAMDVAFGGEEAAIQQPSAIDFDRQQGLMFVLDGTTINVLSTCADGAIIATATISGDGSAAGTDLDFDPVNGALYVSLSNGNLAVFRNFRAQFANDPTPLIVQLQVLEDGNPVDAAASLSAIEHVPEADVLLLADPGAEDGDAGNLDGRLLLVRDASQLISAERVDVVIEGGESQLADPVDIAFDGASLYVVDAALLRLSRYPVADLSVLGSGALAPVGTPTGLDAFGGVPHSLALVPASTGTHPRNLLGN